MHSALLRIRTDFTHLPDRTTQPHFIIYKARGEEIITLGRRQIKAWMADSHLDRQSQLVDRSAPLQWVTTFLIQKLQKTPGVGRTQLRCFWASEKFQQQRRGSSANGEPPSIPQSFLRLMRPRCLPPGPVC